jgi:hypothetical protein
MKLVQLKNDLFEVSEAHIKDFQQKRNSGRRLD